MSTITSDRRREYHMMSLTYYHCLFGIAQAYSAWAGTDAVSLPAYRYYCAIAP